MRSFHLNVSLTSISRVTLSTSKVRIDPGAVIRNACETRVQIAVRSLA